VSSDVEQGFDSKCEETVSTKTCRPASPLLNRSGLILKCLAAGRQYFSKRLPFLLVSET